jgi:hypothetical protein
MFVSLCALSDGDKCLRRRQVTMPVCNLTSLPVRVYAGTYYYRVYSCSLIFDLGSWKHRSMCISSHCRLRHNISQKPLDEVATNNNRPLQHITDHSTLSRPLYTNMDRPFPPSAWRPTKVPDPDDPELSQDTLTTLISDLKSHTRQIYTYPYDPTTWLQRSKTLLKLRYPELAVGDAHKAYRLVENNLKSLFFKHTDISLPLPTERPAQDSGPTDPTKWRLGHRMGFWMLCPLHPDDEAYDGMLQDQLTEISASAKGILSSVLIPKPGYEDDEPQASFHRRPYPWMEREHARRNDGLIDRINHEFEDEAEKLTCLPKNKLCVLRRHAFGVSADPREDTSDILGVFAARDLLPLSTIVVDRSRVWGCNGPGRSGSLGKMGGYKARGCGDPLHPNDEDDDADHCLRWIRDEVGRDAAEVLINVRMLLVCFQDGVQHPLDHPLVARLTPTYSGKLDSKFSVRADIDIPITALQRFGIDPFANPAFDTWVLFTIAGRIDNNSCGDPMSSTIASRFSLFNHSCEPNCRWQTSEDHRTITVRISQYVKEGEQLFVEYDGFISDEGLDKRRQRLWRWLEGPCMCVRCAREESARLGGERQHHACSAVERGDKKMNKRACECGCGRGGGNEEADGKNGWDVRKEELPPL